MSGQEPPLEASSRMASHLSEEEQMLRQLMPHMFPDSDGTSSSRVEPGGRGAAGKTAKSSGLDPITSFLSRLENIEQKSPAAPSCPPRSLPPSPCFVTGGYRARSAAEWLDRPDLLCIERSEKRVVEELRSLPPLDPKRLEEGLTRL